MSQTASPASGDRGFQDLPVGDLRPSGPLRVHRVADDQRMGVAVASVREDGDLDLLTRRDVGDATDEGAELGQRHTHVPLGDPAMLSPAEVRAELDNKT